MTKRRWNLLVWAGLLTALLAVMTYESIFIRFPATRDVPWVNYLLLALALVLSFVGLRRAFRHPDIYRGKIGGSIIGVLVILVTAVFLWGTLYYVRQLPASSGTPHVGQRAPDFTLPDANGTPVTLSSLLASGPNGALLIFYRGYW